MLLKVLYFLFIFLEFSASDLSIGPISLKYIVMPILLFGIIIVEKKIIFDKVWKLYALFILVFVLSCMITGYFDRQVYVNVLFKKYFISFVAWFSTVVMLKKDPSVVKYVAILLLSIGVLDSAVTISQFTFNDAWYKPIESFFRFQNMEDFDALMASKEGRYEVMDRTLPGMFDNGVHNGYFLGVCSVLSIVYVLKKGKIWLSVLPVYFLIGLFCCQQRGPLIISVLILLFGLFAIFRQANTFSRVLIVVLSLVLVGYAGAFLSFSDAMGLRYSTTGLEGTGRNYIYANTLDYISSHPIISNYYELLDEKGNAPHNLFLNAYVYGGLISFILISCILVIQAKHWFNLMKSGFKGVNSFYYAFALAWLGYTLNSLMHNRSIVTGEPIIWLLWGVMVSCPYLIYDKSIQR